MNILLVDDSRAMRCIQRSILHQLGYNQVTEAANGKEALAQARAGQPDLILLDWNMPEMDGPTFVAAFRGAGHDTPIIMVTTAAEKARIAAALGAGVNHYLVKPFTPTVMRERIAETMARPVRAA